MLKVLQEAGKQFKSKSVTETLRYLDTEAGNERLSTDKITEELEKHEPLSTHKITEELEKHKPLSTHKITKELEKHEPLSTHKITKELEKHEPLSTHKITEELEKHDRRFNRANQRVRRANQNRCQTHHPNFGNTFTHTWSTLNL
jgi:hypothetical protein